ncbi:MAG: T9SS type A sorting domain-containing protein [candidate division Zixibacteria bacterium]|nr:T9SS type A sorting domain-containing protein [candidate division Zixibacteria bacterium]
MSTVHVESTWGKFIRRILICAGLTILVLSTANARIIDIPDEYNTIQEGIDASNDGDTVLVQPGEYPELINFNGNNILLCSMFIPTGDSTFIDSTIIQGGEWYYGLVTFENHEDSNAIICGFTLTQNYAEFGGGIFCNNSSPTITNNIISGNYVDSCGGGIYCSSHSNPIIIHNIVKNDSTDFWGLGGGIYCADSSNPIIKFNQIRGNRAGLGAGIYCESSTPVIDNNVIFENVVIDPMGGGGGIYCWNSSPIITNNIIRDNWGAGYEGNGGGIYCTRSVPVIKNNIISGNTATWGGGITLGEGTIICEDVPSVSGNTIVDNFASMLGGGIFCTEANYYMMNNVIARNEGGFYGGGLYFDNTDINLYNNVFYGNIASFGGGVYGEMYSTLTFVNNIFWADSARGSGNEFYFEYGVQALVSYTNIRDTLWPGEGNINEEPLFRDPENNDFHLMASYCGDPYDSPCIDMGDPEISDSILDCDWGLGTERSDMGVYAGDGRAPLVITDDNPVIPVSFILHQNYPNPFNSETTIRYTLPYSSKVRLEIYNLLGQHIETLIDSKQSSGNHSINWDLSNNSSGIYFYKLTTINQSLIKRMTLLK